MKRRCHTILVAAAVAGLLVIPTPIGVREELGWIDAISGSRMTQTRWRFGWSMSPQIVEGPLAARYRLLGLSWTPDWQNIRGTLVNIWGRSVGHGHGTAPQMYSLSSIELQQRYVDIATDDEILTLFRLMSRGTNDEQKVAIDAAAERIFTPSSPRTSMPAFPAS